MFAKTFETQHRLKHTNTYPESTIFLQHATKRLHQCLSQTNEYTESKHIDQRKIFTSTIDLHLQITKQTNTFDMSPVVKS